MAKKSKRGTGEKIEFRWRQNEEEWRDRLVAAAEDADRTVSAQARELVKAALLNPQETQFQLQQIRRELEEVKKLIAPHDDGLSAIQENIYLLRDALVTAVVKILVEAGDMDAATAKEWVIRVLNSE